MARINQNVVIFKVGEKVSWQSTLNISENPQTINLVLNLIGVPDASYFFVKSHVQLMTLE